MIRTYSEFNTLKTFEERFSYLKLGGSVGSTTFGFDRYLNQLFYASIEWRRVRNQVIVRDSGCDLGIQGREIYSGLFIHHINPIKPEDIIRGNEDALLNPEYLVTMTHQTHNSIHYGSDTIPQLVIERKPGDTKVW